MNKQEVSCWSCSHQQIGGDSFLGLCTFFSRVGKPNKEIPATVVDVGCKHWMARGTTNEIQKQRRS